MSLSHQANIALAILVFILMTATGIASESSAVTIAVGSGGAIIWVYANWIAGELIKIRNAILSR